MAMYKKSAADMSTAEPELSVPWNEVENDVSNRLRAITQNVKQVLSQEGLSDVQVEYGTAENEPA